MFTQAEINRAGRVLRVSQEDAAASSILEDWMNLHAQFLTELVPRTVCDPFTIVSPKGITIAVSARPKRRVSILNKLQRFPALHLTKMQDIAGIRYVLYADDKELRDNITWITDFKKRLKEYFADCFDVVRVKDYIGEPKPDGYRGIHYILKYTSDDKFNNLQFELQVRTYYQHLWAMAVETVDMAYGYTLKTGGNDDAGWRDFFKLASMLIARLENAPVLPEYEDKDLATIKTELTTLGETGGYFAKLNALTKLPLAKTSENDFWLLNINVKNKQVNASPFNADVLDVMREFCGIKEKTAPYINGDAHIVIASAKGFRDIVEAYPSYFLDVVKFLAMVRG